MLTRVLVAPTLRAGLSGWPLTQVRRKAAAMTNGATDLERAAKILFDVLLNGGQANAQAVAGLHFGSIKGFVDMLQFGGSHTDAFVAHFDNQPRVMLAQANTHRWFRWQLPLIP
jgi:hypothetical protein